MRAELKSMSADDVNVGSYVPDDLGCFFITFRLRIGLEGINSGDDFEISVCTPTWLQLNMWEPMWGRHLLIVREFDYQKILNMITDGIVRCDGENWMEIASKLARLYAWEFEDYQNEHER